MTLSRGSNSHNNNNNSTTVRKTSSWPHYCSSLSWSIGRRGETFWVLPAPLTLGNMGMGPFFYSAVQEELLCVVEAGPTIDGAFFCAVHAYLTETPFFLFNQRGQKEVSLCSVFVSISNATRYGMCKNDITRTAKRYFIFWKMISFWPGFGYRTLMVLEHKRLVLEELPSVS